MSPLPPLAPEREQLIREMYAYYQDGANLEQVGEKYGFSRERVRQLFARLGLPRRKGGRPRQHQVPDRPSVVAGTVP